MIRKKNFNKEINFMLFTLIVYWTIIQIDINLYNILVPKFLILIIPTILTILGLCIMSNNFSVYTKDIIFMLIPFIIIMYNSIFNGTNIGSIMNICLFIIMLIVTKYINLSFEFIKKVSILFFIINLYWLSIDKFGYNQNTIGNTAIILLSISLIIPIKTSSRYKNIVKILLTLYIIYSNYLILVQSKSRGALIAFIAFILIRFVIPKKILGNRIIYTSIITIMTVGSLLFVGLYTYLWSVGVGNNMIGGKSIFTGREQIWYELFYKFKENVLIGLGSNIALESYISLNIHNGIYLILVIYGLPILVISIFLIFRNLLSVRKVVQIDPLARNSFAIIFMIFINSYFETTLINNTVYPILFLAFSALNSANNRYKIN